ncbi:MAG: SPOR domain-containing protein [Pseudomonadota bacterium]
MNDLLKQRLVGALILLALGVVFWPIIFVEPTERFTLERQPIPPAPQLQDTPIPEPSAAGLRGTQTWEIVDEGDLQAVDEFSPSPPAETTAVAEQEIPESEPSSAGLTERRGPREQAPEQPALDEMGLPIAWILQVASVSSAAKADELRNELLAIEEKAYVKKLQRGDKPLYRVYIGPNVERAKLERIQPRINQQFGVQSMIVRYVP